MINDLDVPTSEENWLAAGDISGILVGLLGAVADRLPIGESPASAATDWRYFLSCGLRDTVSGTEVAVR